MGRIEELARQNLRIMPENPCELWDQLVSEKMQRDGIDRPTAVDRLLATASGSDSWLRCQQHDAVVAKTVVQNGVPIKTGNWLNNNPTGTVRRIPRAP